MTNETKLTAFEWYIEQHNIIVKLGDNISVGDRCKRFSDIIKKTKEMEKEQMRLDIEKKWEQYRIITNNEDAWSFKEWLIKQTYGGNK